MLAFTPHELKLLRLGTRYNNNKPRDPVKFREGDTETYKQGKSFSLCCGESLALIVSDCAEIEKLGVRDADLAG
jgi:hypothetical protein